MTKEAAKSALSSAKSISQIIKGSLVNPATIITGLLAAVTGVYNFIQQRKEALIQSAAEITSSWRKEYDSFNSQVASYQELKAQLDSGDLSDQESYQIKLQILDIQNQITAAYGSQAANLDLINGKLETQVGLLNSLSARDAQKALMLGEKEYALAEEEMTQSRTYELGKLFPNNPANQKVDTAIKEVAESYKDRGIELELTENLDGYEQFDYYTVKFVGDASQAEDTLTAFAAEVNDLKLEFSEKEDLNAINVVYRNTADALQKNQEILDDYQQSYREFLQMELVGRSDGGGEIFNDYTQAVQGYNQALAMGDTEGIREAADAYREAQKAKDEFLSTEGNQKFSALFQDVEDQLDHSSIKLSDFRQAIEGEASSDNLFAEDSLEKPAKELRELQLTADQAFDALQDGSLEGSEALQELAEAWELSPDSAQEVEEFVSVLGQLGLISQSSADQAHILAEALDKVTQRTSLLKRNTEDLNASPLFDSISQADTSRNAGADYQQAVSYLEQAKAMYDQGLTGTDDFKSRAAYFSPTGATDPENFLENYERAARYLTGDRSGVDNFLQDLSQQTDQAGQAFASFDQQTGQWAFHMDDLYQAARQMGMGFEFFMDMFGRLEDYGIGNNFIASAQEGSQRLSDLFVQLAQEKAKLAEMETEGAYETVDENGNVQHTLANQTALDAQRELIRSLNEDILETRENMEALGDTPLDNASALEALENLRRERESILEGNTYEENTEAMAQLLEEQIRQLAEENGIELRPDLSLDLSGLFDDYRREAEESLPAVQELLEESGEPLQLNLESDDPEDINRQIGGLSSALEKFREENGEIDLETDGVRDLADVLGGLYAQKHELEGESLLSLDLSKFDEDTAGVAQKLQDFYQAYSQLSYLEELKALGISVDTSSAEGQLNDVYSQLQALTGVDAQILAKIIPDLSSASPAQIASAIQSLTPEVLLAAKLSVNTAGEGNVDALAQTLNTMQSVSVNASANVLGLASAFLLKSTIDGLASKTVTITTNHVDTYSTVRLPGASVSAGGSGGSQLNGTAHGLGTLGLYPIPRLSARALALGSLSVPSRSFASALAGGSWGTKSAQRALVGELGPELVVYGNRWWTVGDRSAEFAYIPKGAIVFNHRQTRELLANGRVQSFGGRAFALSQGTARASGTALAKGSSQEDFREVSDWIEIAIQRLEQAIDLLEDQASSSYRTFRERGEAIASQMGRLREEISLQQTAYDRYLQQANSLGLSEEWARKVREGSLDLETITDKDLHEQIKEYQDWYEKALDCSQAVEELKESLKDLYSEAFDQAVDEFDSALSLAEHRAEMIEGYIDQTEAKGYLVSSKYYDSLLLLEEENAKKLTQEREALMEAMNSALSSGEIKQYSEAWYEMQEEINSVNQALQDSNTSIVEFGNHIRELSWEVFDKLQDSISQLTQESDFLNELLENRPLFQEDGSSTDAFTASLGLHGLNYNVYMEQARQYREEMLRIQEELAKDPNNQTLLERRQELLELQQESILSAEDEKEAITRLVEDAMDAQLDALKELIDKYEDTLDSQQELLDYQKKVKKHTQELSELQKQLAAYQGDLSEENRARLQELQADYAEAREELQETQYDRYLSQQEQLLDALYSEYESILNSRLDNVDALLEDVIANINSESSSIRDTISQAAGQAGYTLSEAMNMIWSDSGNAGKILSTYGSGISASLTALQTGLEAIRQNLETLVRDSHQEAQGNLSHLEDTLTEQTAAPPAPAPEPSPAPAPELPQEEASFFISRKSYYNKSKLNKEISITDRLAYHDFDWSFLARKQYYEKMGLSGTYRGTAQQNHDMIQWMKSHGYRTGTRSVPADGLYWTSEGAPETIIRRSDHAILTPLSAGDQVLNHRAHENIWAMANDPKGFLLQNLDTLRAPASAALLAKTTSFQTNIQIDKVADYQDFVTQLQRDHKFERLIQSMTVDRLAGGGSLAKYKYHF